MDDEEVEEEELDAGGSSSIPCPSQAGGETYLKGEQKRRRKGRVEGSYQRRGNGVGNTWISVRECK